MSSRNLVINNLLTVSLGILFLAQLAIEVSCQNISSKIVYPPSTDETGNTTASGKIGLDSSSAKRYLGNAIAMGSDIIPIYPIKDKAFSGIAFISMGNSAKAVLTDGSEVWSKSIEGDMFGGFDFNQDGWPDLGFGQSMPSDKTCGNNPMLKTAIILVDGRTGNEVYRSAPLEDKCWSFPLTPPYTTSQWTYQSVLFGADTGTLAVLPYYATQGWFFSYNGTNGFNSNYFFYPSTSSYDHYVNAKENAWGQRQSYVENSDLANGLIIKSQNDERLIFFTSGRVVQYRVNAYTTSQLLCDHPFLNDGRKDRAGRNKGLVSVDPNYPQNIVLIAGTDVYSVVKDLQAGKMEFDPWGHIERHVTLYNYQTNELQDRFFSYAHDPNNTDQYKYVGRTVYPANPFLKIRPGTASRIAYNVYDDKVGHWQLHISQPGSTTDNHTIPDVFLWDIRDINADGMEELIASPTMYTTDPESQRYYFPRWKTSIYRWNESALSMDILATYEGIPYLKKSFREPTRTTINGYLYPVLTVERNKALELVLYTSSRQIQFVKTADFH